jgi:WS/DGAT/MGAT family acyltransferase
MHLIEGLEDGRFAAYFKLHHAVMDGVSGLRLLQTSLTTDPDDRSLRAAYLARESHSNHNGSSFGPSAVLGLARSALTETMAVGPLMVRAAERLVREQAAALPSAAPRTILNGPITGSRRFAAQSWELPRLKAIGAAAGGTLNDAVLAVCAGALRSYLDEQGELPDAPLIAMVPVSLNAIGLGTVGAGNNVGAILANLATDEPDPARRMDAIMASMLRGKELLGSLSKLQVMGMSAISMAPLAMSAFFGINRLLPPPFNLVISNVPGPKVPLWMQGAKLDAFYPLSIPTVGQALNITVTSYVDNMEFGLTGCRRYVPHLQRLLMHIDTSIEDLERALL